MSSDRKTETGRRAGLKGTLLASVFALGLGGLAVGEALDVFQSPAQAQNLSAGPQNPAEPMMSFADVVDRVQPAVVSIRVKADVGAGGQQPGMQGMPNVPEDSPLYDFFRRFGMPNQPGMPGQGGPGAPHRFGLAQGSGFFISADGYAVTNNHVVENAEEVQVVTTDGKEYAADVIGTDPKTDLALVKVRDGKDLPYVAFAPGEIRVGDWVVAVGNPFGLGGTVTAGIVSARGRDIGAGPYDDFIQIDAPINKGNSGGPTFNLSGEVIGVNTAIFSPSGGSVGIGFAIPARTAQAVIEDLKDDGKVVRGWLGVQIQPVTQDIADSLGLAEARGALVADPQPNSPAAKAGIEPGDVVTAVNGEPVDDARMLARTIAGYPPETTVDVTLWRDGEQQTVKVNLGQLPEDPQVAAASPDDRGGAEPTSVEGLGLRLAPAAAVGAGEQGVVITEIDPNGEAAGRGLSQGDVILEVAGEPVSAPADVVAGVRQAEQAGRKAVLMRVQSGERTRFLALPIGNA